MAREPSSDIGPAYDAFISYSQRGDKAVAGALRSVIQTIGKPWWKVRSLNVFLDATSLSAAPGLWQGIEEKLDRSRYLILLASPEAAASKWVDREVAHFIATRGINHLLIALTGGELAWDDAAGDFRNDDAPLPLPPCLRARFAEEPLWVDLRAFRADPSSATKSNQAFLHAALDLAATIKGVEKADLYSEEVRRQRRSVRVAYGISVVVAGLAVGAGIAAWIAVENEQRATAEAERAIRNFDIAKSTVDQVIFDIAQGLRTVEGMRIESVRTILSRVESAMEKLGDAAPDDLEVQRSRAVMLNEFGDTYLDAGDGPAALAAHAESLAISRRLAGTDPANAGWQRDVSVSLDRIGDVKLRAGDAGAALAAYNESLAIRRRLANADPGNTERQSDVSISLDSIGDMKLRAGDAAAALAAYDESLAVRRRLAVTDTGNAEWQRDVSVSLGSIGDVRLRAGDAAAALAAYEEGLAIRRRLAETEPGNTEWLRDVSVSLNSIGDVKLRAGDAAAALAAYEEVVAIGRRLAATDPDNTLWQRDVSVSLTRVGDLKLRSGDDAAALADHTESLAIRRRLADTDPGNTDWQSDVSVSLDRIGDVKLEAGDDAGALAAYDESLAIRRRLADTDPASTGWQRDVAFGFNNIGDVKLRAGDAAGALAAYDESLAMRRRLADTDPGNTEWQRDVSVGLSRIGNLKLEAGDDAGALAAYEESLAIGRRLADTDPGNAEWRSDVVVSLTKVQGMIDDADRRRALLGEARGVLNALEAEGRLLADQQGWVVLVEDQLASLDANDLDRLGDEKFQADDSAGALAAWDQSLVIRRRLADTDPSSANWRSVTDSLWKLGEARLAAGDTDAALADWDEGLAIADRMAEAAPTGSLWPNVSVFLNKRIGVVKLRAGDVAGALAAYEESIATDRQLVAADPDNPEWRRRLVGTLGSTAFLNLTIGHFEKAESLTREGLSLDPDQRWQETNLAHALMFQDRIEDADALYLSNRGIEVQDKPWEDVILADFADFRARGITHPHMEEIERIFSGEGDAAPATEPEAEAERSPVAAE